MIKESVTIYHDEQRPCLALHTADKKLGLLASSSSTFKYFHDDDDELIADAK